VTTIVIDAKTKAVYADSRTTVSWVYGSVNYKEDTIKAFKLGNVIITACGDGDLYNKIKENSLIKGHLALPEHYYNDDMEVYCVYDKGDCLQVDTFKPVNKNSSWFTYILKNTYDKWIKTKTTFIHCEDNNWITAGSGGNNAHVAMLCGKTPEEAIKIAALCDLGTNNVVTKVSF